MQITVVTDQPLSVHADILVVPVSTGGPPADDLLALDAALGGLLGRARELGEVTGRRHATALLPSPTIGSPWILAVGIGDGPGLDARGAVRLGATAVRRLAGRRLTRLAVWLPASLEQGGLVAATVAELVVRGIVEGGYEPGLLYRDRIDDSPVTLDELLLVHGGGDATAIAAAAERGRIIGEGTNDARTLSQRSANDLTPARFAEEALERAARYGWQTEILDLEAAQRMGMGMFSAVGMGSDRPPRMITLRTAPGVPADARGRLIGLVGKGVTFDTGGINLKQMERMGDERIDKAGGATVLAALTTISRLAPDAPVLGVIPAVENVPGPHSALPGDVVRALNGKTVEIVDTDAEGRLILGDALTWAERNGATHLLTVATLTGLSEQIGMALTGGHGEPQGWWDEVAEAGATQGERHFQLPLIDEYLDSMQTWYADLGNVPGDRGKAIKSGLFLRQFRTRPWVFLDLSWLVWQREATPWSAVGTTGATLATLVDVVTHGRH